VPVKNDHDNIDEFKDLFATGLKSKGLQKLSPRNKKGIELVYNPGQLPPQQAAQPVYNPGQLPPQQAAQP